MTSSSTLFYDLGLYGSYVAGAVHLRTRSSERRLVLPHARVPRSTLVVMAMVAVVTTLQFFCPAILAAFERNAFRIAAGEWWRLITALFAQDGGWIGGLFNVIGLFFVGSVAERLWGGHRWLILFFAGGVISEVIGLAWQPIGAGNSVANFSLAGAVALACLADEPSRFVLIVTVIALGADGWLFLSKDLHGAAALVGAVLATALIALRNGRASTRRSS